MRPGTIISTAIAMMFPHTTEPAIPTKKLMPTESGYFSWSFIIVSANMNSCHAIVNANSATAAMPGAATGRKTRRIAPTRLHPSIIAESSSSRGTVSK